LTVGLVLIGIGLLYQRLLFPPPQAEPAARPAKRRQRRRKKMIARVAARGMKDFGQLI
jgi:hypothetical protein